VKLRPSGNRNALFAGITSSSTSPPKPGTAISRSPTDQPSTPSPTSITSPAISPPGANGRGGLS